MLTLQSEIKEQNTYYAGNLVGSGREVVAIAFVSGFNLDRAVEWLNNNANQRSTSNCAKYVRMGLEHGGVSTDGRPGSAKDYGPFLKGKGFRIVIDEEYLKGDISVFEAFKGVKDHRHGHIQMYNGNQWISDFYQNGFWAGSDYSTYKPNYKIYRWK